MRRLMIPLLLGGSLALQGCLAGMAAGAVGAAVRGAQPNEEPSFDPLVQERAIAACRTHAARSGSVTVIDVEPRRNQVVVVYGTVDGPPERRSFECSYGRNGRVSGFTLRPVSRQR